MIVSNQPFAGSSPRSLCPGDEMIKWYLRSVYRRTMLEAYEAAYRTICASVGTDAMILDCGAGDGGTFEEIAARSTLLSNQYRGIEWDQGSVERGRLKGLDITQGDLNFGISHPDGQFSCVYGLSMLEHLLNPCRFLKECHRVLQPGGRLVLLTPNISTYFTATLILLGKMPSTGPHPDSNELLRSQELVKVSMETLRNDADSDRPQHRHLVVFSYRVLRDYLRSVGFKRVEGAGFGLYPFPNFIQPVLEKIDPYHCHQMVFVASK